MTKNRKIGKKETNSKQYYYCIYNKQKLAQNIMT